MRNPETMSDSNLMERFLKHGTALKNEGVLCITIGIEDDRKQFVIVRDELKRRLDERHKLLAEKTGEDVSVPTGS